MKRIGLLMLIIIMLITTAVSCAPKDDTLGVSKSSLVEPDGWVYYFNPDGIYKIRENCEDKTLVLDKTVFKFQIYKNRIYYITYKEDASTYYSIYSCKTDGSDDKLICDTLFEVFSYKRMQIVDDWIYVGIEKDVENGDEYELYRVKIDGTDMTMITPWNELFVDYSIDDDGWIYYLTAGEFEGKRGGQLWRMHHDGKHTQQVMQEVGWAIDYSDNEIYYSDVDDGNIYAIPFFESKKRKIADFDGPVYDIKIIDDWIYYNLYGVDNWGFYKIKIDGSENTKIPVENIPSFNRIMVVDNWLIYLDNFEYLEMVRIRDTYDTDSLVDYLNGEIWLKLFKKSEIEVRKYE